MRQEAGGTEVPPPCKGSLALWGSARPEASGGCHGDVVPTASPSLWPLPFLKSVPPTHTDTHIRKLRMIQLSPRFTGGETEARAEDLPEVSWQRRLRPRPPDQPGPFLTWQLSPLCAGPRPLPFLREPAPHPSSQPES